MSSAYQFDLTGTAQGAIFGLNGPAKRDRQQTLGPWDTDLRQGGSHLCLRGTQTDQNRALETIAKDAHPAAEDFLDIVAVEERNALVVAAPHDNFVWRVGPHGLKGQLTTSITFAAEPPAVRAVVRDASGEIVPPPAYVPPPHHAAYRYFRYSQAAQNVFDAYRNMFLALESVLDHIEQKRSSDGETDWLRRAMTVAATRYPVDLRAFPKAAGQASVDAFIDAHYSAVRCAVFHAKTSGGRALRPGTLRDHDVVLHQLLAVQKVVEDLLKALFSVKLPHGGFFHAGFGHLLSELAPATGLLVCVGECPTIEQLNGPQDGLPDGDLLKVRFDGLRPGTTDEWLFVSEIKCAELGFSSIASLRLFAGPNNHMFLGPIADKLNRTLLTTDLDLRGMTKLVVRVRCVLRNLQSPRRSFGQ